MSYIKLSLIFLILLNFISCETTTNIEDISGPTDPNHSDPNLGDDDDEDDDINVGTPITTNVRMFIFGHSLIDHRPPVNPTPSDETTVPHWLSSLSSTSAFQYRADGKYGQLRSHLRDPVIPQWGYDLFTGLWDGDSSDTFSDIDYNTIMFTPANFIQWFEPDEDFYDEAITPVEITNQLIDSWQVSHPNAKIYLYMNWPDMAPFIAGQGWPPNNEVEVDNFHADTISGNFYNWNIRYHDLIMQERPSANVRMIPSGLVISRLLTLTNISSIGATDLYEDNAPHGRPTIYFLSSLVSYMAIYGVRPPSDYIVPNTVHQTVRDNYLPIVEFIWTELQNFNDNSGNSRVY